MKNDWKPGYLTCNSFLNCDLSPEIINGAVQADFLRFGRHTFVKLDRFQIDWFERHLHLLTPETRRVMINVFEEAKDGPWGYPLMERHMVDMLLLGDVFETWERKLERGRVRDIK